MGAVVCYGNGRRDVLLLRGFFPFYEQWYRSGMMLEAVGMLISTFAMIPVLSVFSCAMKCQGQDVGASDRACSPPEDTAAQLGAEFLPTIMTRTQTKPLTKSSPIGRGPHPVDQRRCSSHDARHRCDTE